MKYQLFLAAFILLLGVSTSQDVDVPCKQNVDCQYLGNAPQTVICSDGYCKCPGTNGTMQNCASINVTVLKEAQQSAGVLGTLVGHTCSMDIHCTTGDENAFCNTTRKQCECKASFVPSLNNSRCLPFVAFNMSKCEIESQCLASTPNTTCSSTGFCICAESYHYYGKACWSKKAFGSSCSVSAECTHVQDSVCNDQSLCSCPTDRVIDPNTTACLRIASKLEDYCIESIQCTQLLGAGGTCTEKHCRCHENHHHSSVSFKCELDLGIGGQCKMDYECSDGGKHGEHGPMRCVKNRCTCAEEFAEVEGKCQPIVREVPVGTNNGNAAASRLGDVASFVMALAYFVLLSAIL